MPGRNQQGDYRYAYQGQEKDPETGWEAFELRMYDGRVGRWMTMDPYSQYHSPYLAMGNNPINLVDPDGGFAFGGGDPPLEVMMIDGQKIYYNPNIVATIKASPISSNSSNTLDYIQLALDIGGSTEIPVVSQFADFSSGTISLFRGNWGDAGLSYGGILIPGLSQAKLLKTTVKNADELYAIAAYGNKSKIGLKNHHNIMDAWAKVNIDDYISRQYNGTTIRLTDALHKKAHEAERAWMRATFGKVRGNWNNMTPQQVQELSEVMFDAAGVPESARRQFYKEFNNYLYGL